VAVTVFLYGPPGVGKTTVGRMVAARLAWRFVDLDALIVSRTGRSIESLFADGEAAFRRVEREVCRELAREDHLVVALGAGAMLDADTRDRLTRHHLVVCLTARPATLQRRLKSGATRPLLSGRNGREKLARLLADRAAVYDGCSEQIVTDGRTPAQVAASVVSLLKMRALRIRRLRQRIVLGHGLLDQLPALVEADDVRLARPTAGRMVIVTDRHVQKCQGARFPTGVARVVIPPGESSKSFGELRRVARRLVAAGLDRGGTVVAIGGGVVNDLAGLAAATFMRGVRWVTVPTSLLAMVDASIGGKTGIDLPEGKNLVGAFHPASLVAIDPLVLGTLPAEEWTAGMAEVVKHAVIGAPDLFSALERGRRFGAIEDLAEVIDVKRAIVDRDPFERDEREVLNLGHTIGHGIEAASRYRVRHGEAVAIGMVGAARLSEELGLARRGLAARIERVLGAQGLPTRLSGVSASEVRAAMGADKKKRGTQLRFALPAAIGRVVTGVEVPERTLMAVLKWGRE
jgi:3-dehydroquinate synthase